MSTELEILFQEYARLCYFLLRSVIHPGHFTDESIPAMVTRKAELEQVFAKNNIDIYVSPQSGRYFRWPLAELPLSEQEEEQVPPLPTEEVGDSHEESAGDNEESSNR